MQQMFDLKERTENQPEADLLIKSGLENFAGFDPIIDLQNISNQTDIRLVSQPDALQNPTFGNNGAGDDLLDVQPSILDQDPNLSTSTLATPTELKPSANQQADLFINPTDKEEPITHAYDSGPNNPQPSDTSLTIDTAQNEDSEVGAEVLTADQKIEEQTLIGQLAAIENDIEDDIYNRDGGTNDSEMAGSRLAAMSGRLSGYFANMASGLVSMRMVALAKKDADNTKQIQLDIQDDKEKEKEEKDKKEQEDFEEGMSQGNDNYQSQTISQSTLDNMEWEGDQNDIWEFMGQSGSRQSWYEAAKSVRQKLNKTAKENNWSDDTKAKQEMLLSQYMEALKKNDPVRAAEILEKMDPRLQAKIAEERKWNSTKSNELNAPTSTVGLQVNALSESTETSIDARDQMVNAAALTTYDDRNLQLVSADMGEKPMLTGSSKVSGSVASEFDEYRVAGNATSLTENFNPVATQTNTSPATTNKVELAATETQQPLTGLNKGFSLG